MSLVSIKSLFLRLLGALCVLVLLATGGAQNSWAQGIPVQEAAEFYGLNKEEEAALYGGKNGNSADFARKFKAGRAGTGTTRGNNIIFMHDDNFDGLTDHSDKVRGVTRLEIETNNANGNLIKGDDNARKQAMIEWREKTEKDCRKRVGVEAKRRTDANNANPSAKPQEMPDVEAICHQPSPNLENKGPTHGGPFNSHREYALTDKAKKAAEKVGAEYAVAALSEGANYDYKNNQDIRKSNRKGKIEVRTLNNGKVKWEERDVAPNPDLMYSEAAALEEQKLLNLQQGAKLFKARQLADSEFRDDPELEHVVAYAYKSGNPQDVQRADALVASKVAEKRMIGIKEFCLVSGKLVEANQPGCNSNPDDPKSTPKKYKDIISGMNSSQQNAMRAEAFNSLTPEEKKKAQEWTQKITQCMGSGQWCDAKVSSDNNDKDTTYKKVTGDPGAVFKDTRAYVYDAALQAYRAPLDQQEALMKKNSDYGNTADMKDYSKQVKENQAAAKEFLDSERKREQFSKGQYKSPYLKGQFNTRTMSSRQLFGRNPARGDASYLGSPNNDQFRGPAGRVQTGSMGSQQSANARRPQAPQGGPGAVQQPMRQLPRN